MEMTEPHPTARLAVQPGAIGRHRHWAELVERRYPAITSSMLRTIPASTARTAAASARVRGPGIVAPRPV
jgi:hypothetical protein